MWSEDKEYFHQIEKSCGSKFEAINRVSKLAREKLKESNNTILESKAITWAITGISPDLSNRHVMYDDSNIIDGYNYHDIEDLLCYVDDEDVCESVRDSYRASLSKGHLIYLYNSTLDESRKCRVRILTRMVWDCRYN